MAIRTDWRIGKKAGACTGCGSAFPVETPFHSAIYREGEGFARRDLCDPCFDAGGGEPYSHWRTVLPRAEERKRVFDLGLAAEFLRRLVGEGDPEEAALVHLLAILLVRKRVVRLLDLPGDERGPRARVEFPAGGEPLDIPAPPLMEKDVPALREQLGRLLDLGRE